MGKLFLLFLSCLFAGSLSAQMENMPANPEPGKCYIRHVTEPQFDVTEKRILVHPAYTQLTKVPAEYKTVEERVLVKEASKKFVPYPAEYKTVVDTIQIEAGYNAVTLIPAQFGENSEYLEFRPKTADWEYRYDAANCKSADPNDCMVLQYVERPAEYKNIATKTLAQDASFTTAKAGGKWQLIKRQVVAKEAGFEEVTIPAEYATITKRVLVKDESVFKKEIPAEYAVQTVEVLREKGGEVVWEEIACELTENNLLPINYDFGSTSLTLTSRSIIDAKLLGLMKDKPNVRVQISSYTDSRGAAEDNLKLSQGRAQAVVNYLVEHGIQKNRLIAKGYGETQLKNGCADGVECSEKQHAENRRTEFRVLNN